jgi:hypothetical protein
MMRVWIRPCCSSVADRADAAVHHVAGGDDVDAGLGLHQRLLAQHRHRLVVQDVAAVVEQPVLAVRGEGVQRHVGEQAELGEALLEVAHGARHQAFGVGRLAAVGRLQRRFDDREQRHHRHAQRHALLGHREQPVDAHALHAGHAGHVLPLAVAVEQEDRQDQVLGGQAVLAHQRTGESVAAQAARPAGGKGGGVITAGVLGGGPPAGGGQTRGADGICCRLCYSRRRMIAVRRSSPAFPP